MDNISYTKPWITLPDGLRFPTIGYGTYDLVETEATAIAVEAAIAAGYRLIDTAAGYNNEEGVGLGVRRSSVPRETIIVSSKVWPDDLGYDRTMKSFEKSMRLLKLDYMDQILIHWPCSHELNAGSWKAFEKLHEEKAVRHIGVSNFNINHLEALRERSAIPPLVNQIEFHPYFYDDELVAYCHANGIIVEAWSPLMQGEAFSNQVLGDIAKKHGRSIAQVVLRWCLQRGTVPLPKTRTPSRMSENLSLFDFSLDDDDMAAIRQLYSGKRRGPAPESYRFCPVKPDA